MALLGKKSVIDIVISNPGKSSCCYQCGSAIAGVCKKHETIRAKTVRVGANPSCKTSQLKSGPKFVGGKPVNM